MLRSLSNFFQTIDNFLQACEDYLDLNVRSGKIFRDIPYLFRLLKILLARLFHWFIHTKRFRNFVNSSWQLANRLGIIAFLARIGGLVLDGRPVFIENYAEFFSFFACLLGPSALLLMTIFEYSSLQFFTFFLPLLLFNIVLTETIFLLVDKRAKQNKERFVLYLKNHLPSLSSAITVSLISLFTLCDIVAVVWFTGAQLATLASMLSGIRIVQFFLWFVVAYLFLGFLVGIFIFMIFVQQAFFNALLERQSPSAAFLFAVDFVTAYKKEFRFHTLVFSVVFVSFVYLATRVFADIGFALCLGLLFFLSLFLHFLLRKRYRSTFANEQKREDVSVQKYYRIVIIISILSGIVSYLAIARFSSQAIAELQFVSQRSQVVKALPKDFVLYQDVVYGYAISYPKSWDFYRWQQNWVRFFTNFTGTDAGTAWIDISVSPLSDSYFFNLSESQQGLFSKDQQTHTTVSKIANLSMGGYDAVKYIVTTNDSSSPEFQTHYLVHKGDYAYDISIVTHDQYIQQSNDQLFADILNSFHFVN